MSLLPQGSDKEVVPNTFASQYISIILIIFTCMVWAFFSDSKKLQPANQKASTVSAKQEELEQAKPAVPLSKELSSLALDQLFSVSGDSLDENNAEALSVFLSSHDVDAEFEIKLRDESTERAFLMSRVLENFFDSKALPAGSARVFVLTAQQEEGVRVYFKKSRPEIVKEES